MKRIEQIAVAFIVIGILMKILLIQGGSAVVGISLTFLACIYYPLGIFYFNAIPPNKIFKKESYDKLTAFRGIGTFGGGLIFSILLVAILFKLLQLPGSRVMFIVGLGAGALFMVIVLFNFLRNRDSHFLKVMVIRTMIILGISGIVNATPGLMLVKVFHRDNPEYIEAYEELQKDPRNEELQQKAEDAREKTNN